jgi:hypothetical protein
MDNYFKAKRVANIDGFTILVKCGAVENSGSRRRLRPVLHGVGNSAEARAFSEIV